MNRVSSDHRLPAVLASVTAVAAAVLAFGVGRRRRRRLEADGLKGPTAQAPTPGLPAPGEPDLAQESPNGKADSDAAEEPATQSSPLDGPPARQAERRTAVDKLIVGVELAMPVSLILLQTITRFPFAYRHLSRLRTGLVAAMLVTGALRHGFKLRPRRQQRYLLGMLLWSVISYSASDKTRKSPRVILQRAWLALVLNHFVWLSRRHPTHRRTLLRAVVFSGTANGLLAILQYVSVERGVLAILKPLIIPKVDRDRSALGAQYARYVSWGSFNHPNLLGAYLALAVPLAIALDRSNRRWPRIRTLLPIVMGLKYSGSRGGQLNALIGAAFLAIDRKILSTRPEELRVRYRRGLQKILLLAALIYRYPHWFIAIAKRLPTRSSGMSNRDIIWKNTIPMIVERPLLGVGPGAYSHEYLERFDFPSIIERATAEQEKISLGHHYLSDHWHAHNFFLNTAAESGLPAAGLAALFFVSALRAHERASFKFSEEEATDQELLDSWLASGCSAALAGNFIHSFFDTPCNLDYPPIGFAFMAIMALGAGD